MSDRGKGQTLSFAASAMRGENPPLSLKSILRPLVTLLNHLQATKLKGWEEKGFQDGGARARSPGSRGRREGSWP